MLNDEDIKKLLKVLVSKNDLKDFVSKEDVKDLVSKEDLKDLASKEDLRNLVSKEDLKDLASKEDLKTVKTQLKDLNEKVDEVVDFIHIVEEVTDKRLKVLETKLNLPPIQI